MLMYVCLCIYSNILLFAISTHVGALVKVYSKGENISLDW